MKRSVFRQYFAIVFSVLLVNHSVADQMLPGLMQAATKEVVRSWVQSLAWKSLLQDFSEMTRSLSDELSVGAHSMASAMAASPFLLPLWLPALLLGSAFFLSTVAPKILPSMVESLSPILSQMSVILEHLGMDDVARAIEPKELHKLLQPGELVERGLDVLDVKQVTCRRKLFCEVGSYVLDKQPAIARFIDLFSDTIFRAVSNYSEPLSQGIRGGECNKLFKKCKESPYGKMLNYYFV